jgi:hypothetical protein
VVGKGRAGKPEIERGIGGLIFKTLSCGPSREIRIRKPFIFSTISFAIGSENVKKREKAEETTFLWVGSFRFN